MWYWGDTTNGNTNDNVIELEVEDSLSYKHVNNHNKHYI